MKPIDDLKTRLPKLYSRNSCDHDLAHIRRVVKRAQIIGQRERARLSILLPAAMLHDISLEKGTVHVTNKHHATLGAKKAKAILEDCGFANVPQICRVIRQHSIDSPTNEPRTLEGDCLFDADKLDAVTPLGVARVLQESALDENRGPVETAKRLLKWLKAFRFKTRTGRTMGRDRQEAMSFCEAIIRCARIQAASGKPLNVLTQDTAAKRPRNRVARYSEAA